MLHTQPCGCSCRVRRHDVIEVTKCSSALRFESLARNADPGRPVSYWLFRLYDHMGCFPLRRIYRRLTRYHINI